MINFNQEQTIELLRLINTAIYKTLGWLSDDKKEDLASIAYIELCQYQPSESYPDALPNYTYIKGVVVHQAYNPDNYIIVAGQRKAEIEEAELQAVRDELNLEGEESRFAGNFREVSYEQLVADTGFEVSCPSIEQQIIEHSEEIIYDNQVNAFKDSPMFNAILISAIAHVEGGGTFKSFAEAMGYSPQSLKNLIRRRVDQSNDPNNVMLPFTEYLFNDAPKTKKQYKQSVRFADTSVQLSLF